MAIVRNLVILFLALVFLSLYGQTVFHFPKENIELVEHIATYSLEFQEDSTRQNYKRQEDMLLFIGPTVSRFVSYNYFIADSMARTATSQEDFQRIASDRVNPLPIVRFRYEIFKNYPKGKQTFIDNILGGGMFKFEEDLALFKWELHNETAIISGYNAQKATTEFGGRKWVAWFSTEIPFNDGPYKFNGLPGLIVKVYDTYQHYVFELKSIHKPGHKFFIGFPELDYIESTKKEYFKAKDNMRDNITTQAKSAGLNNEVQQKVAKTMLRRNNPIELDRK
ncbi:MAG: GLPGLI family protein [Bacteroidales bacterium]|jgi:GLPGLI family protein|nr:GLPGLI family protein [Bacteroidales bacterium]